MSSPPLVRLPPWARKGSPLAREARGVRVLLRDGELHTVCEEARCPNLGECFSRGTATFMLLGDRCTRRCGYCSVGTAKPLPPDPGEPARVAEAAARMSLKYVVLTSVNRDDLEDGGAAHYAACVRAIRELCPETAVEALTPDFQGRLDCVETVVDSGLQVFAQNIETVRRLTHPVRDPRAGYEQTLQVLAHAKAHRPEVLTKTSLMLGLGETDDEIAQTFADVRAAGVDIVTLGQYLRPTANHLPVERFVTPEQFDAYRRQGLEHGFLEVVAGPLVRSSYRADRVFEGNNVGLADTG